MAMPGIVWAKTGLIYLIYQGLAQDGKRNDSIFLNVIQIFELAERIALKGRTMAWRSGLEIKCLLIFKLSVVDHVLHFEAHIEFEVFR
jgi:hypothetical protein